MVLAVGRAAVWAAHPTSCPSSRQGVKVKVKVKVGARLNLFRFARGLDAPFRQVVIQERTSQGRGGRTSVKSMHPD